MYLREIGRVGERVRGERWRERWRARERRNILEREVGRDGEREMYLRERW